MPLSIASPTIVQPSTGAAAEIAAISMITADPAAAADGVAPEAGQAGVLLRLQELRLQRAR